MPTEVWKNRRVAIVFWDGYLGVAPSLINASRCFAADGFNVDIILRQSSLDFADIPDLGSSVRVATAPARRRPRRLRIRTAAFIADRLKFVAFSWRVTRGRRYDAVIGVDLNGLVAAWALALVKRTRVVLWSLEIHASPPSTSLRGQLSRRFRKLTFGRTPLTVVQDEHRARLLVEHYGVRKDSIVLVPNGPIGDAAITSSDFLRQRASVPPGHKIALHLGMISPTVLSAELAEAAREWPNGWTLVFHERQRRDPNDPYVSLVRKNGEGRTRFSLEPVAYDDLDRVVASARVGLVLYDASAGLTYSSPGSSGKVGQYLRCGVPVICLRARGISETIQRYGCGISVDAISEISAALEAVDREWDSFSTNALRCYLEVYEFSSHFASFMKRLRGV